MQKKSEIHMQIQQERISASPSTSERNRKREGGGGGPAAETMAGIKGNGCKVFFTVKKVAVDKKKYENTGTEKAGC